MEILKHRFPCALCRCMCRWNISYFKFHIFFRTVSVSKYKINLGRNQKLRTFLKLYFTWYERWCEEELDVYANLYLTVYLIFPCFLFVILVWSFKSYFWWTNFFVLAGYLFGWKCHCWTRSRSWSYSSIWGIWYFEGNIPSDTDAYSNIVHVINILEVK